MPLHRYLIRFTSFKCVAAMNLRNEPYTLPMLEDHAKGRQALFEQEVKAFTAEDALTQLRAAEGGSLGQPPFVFAIEPFPDDDARERSKGSWEKWTDKDIAIELGPELLAKCACGAVAVQWRKDKPVCAIHRNEENDE